MLVKDTSVLTGSHKLLQWHVDLDNEIAFDFCLKHAIQTCMFCKVVFRTSFKLKGGVEVLVLEKSAADS